MVRRGVVVLGGGLVVGDWGAVLYGLSSWSIAIVMLSGASVLYEPGSEIFVKVQGQHRLAGTVGEALI